jgi:nucleoside 2-deoxyribosyltransferase
VKKVFLAVSFSDKVDPDGVVQPKFRAFVEKVLADLRADGVLDVFCALEYEGWKISDELAEVGVKKDLNELDGADALVVLLAPAEQPSAGTRFEMGYAVAKGKKLILAAHTSDPLGFFTQGAVNAGLVTLVNYDAIDMIGSQLVVAINAPER